MNTNMNMHMNMSTNSKTQKGPPDPPGLPIAEEEIIVNLPALILAYNQDFTRGNHQRAQSYSNRDAPPLFKKTLESVLGYQHAMDYFVQTVIATSNKTEDDDEGVEWREDDANG